MLFGVFINLSTTPASVFLLWLGVLVCKSSSTFALTSCFDLCWSFTLLLYNLISYSCEEFLNITNIYRDTFVFFATNEF